MTLADARKNGGLAYCLEQGPPAWGDLQQGSDNARQSVIGMKPAMTR
jgi:hypothetical protein